VAQVLGFFTGWMSFLPPIQQCQSTQGNNNMIVSSPTCFILHKVILQYNYNKCTHYYYLPWPILLRAKCFSTFNSPAAKISIFSGNFHKITLDTKIYFLARMWANGQHDGRPAKYRWRPRWKFHNSIPCTIPQTLADSCCSRAMQ